MQQQFQGFKTPGFRVVENIQNKTGFGFGKTRIGNTTTRSGAGQSNFFCAKQAGT